LFFFVLYYFLLVPSARR